MTKVEMLDKLRRVVESCKTFDQLDCAERYSDLWISTYIKMFRVDVCDRMDIRYMAHGILHTKEKQLRHG